MCLVKSHREAEWTRDKTNAPAKQRRVFNLYVNVMPRFSASRLRQRLFCLTTVRKKQKKNTDVSLLPFQSVYVCFMDEKSLPCDNHGGGDTAKKKKKFLTRARGAQSKSAEPIAPQREIHRAFPSASKAAISWCFGSMLQQIIAAADCERRHACTWMAVVERRDARVVKSVRSLLQRGLTSLTAPC